MGELQRDEVLGACYLDPEEFVRRKHVFGVGMALQGYTRDDLLALLADASRKVEEETGRVFTPETITERQRFNENTRRVFVNSPPVVELVSFGIEVSNRQVATFRVDDIYIDTQRGFLEVLDFSLASSLTTPLIMYGLTDPMAVVEYKTLQEVPAGVKRATGIYAAWKANRAFVDALVPQGFGSLTVGGAKLSNVSTEPPKEFYAALADFIRLPIG